MTTHEQLGRSFVSQLEAALVRRGMCRASIARRTGKSRANVTKALRPGNNLTISTMAEMASAVGFELHFRLIGPDAPEPERGPDDHPEYRLAA